VQKLEAHPGAAGSFAAKELRARLLKAQGRGRDAADLLTRYADEGGNVRAAAALLEDLAEPGAAERLYRRFAQAAAAKQPEAALVLATFLGRQKRVREALDLCEGAGPNCPPALVAQACLLIVSGGAADAAQLARAERWLRGAGRKAPQSPTLPAALAHVLTLQGRYDEAEAAYRQALEATGDKAARAAALNNLAFLLALQPGGDGARALALAQQACDLGGPLPRFLDTRGVARLKLGKAREAVKDLSEAVAEAPSSSAFFHLARAHALARDFDNARRAWRQARSLGLKPSSIHPLERKAYDELAGLANGFD
jgi:tetratricopeptide (TPR) repeat protein